MGSALDIFPSERKDIAPRAAAATPGRAAAGPLRPHPALLPPTAAPLAKRRLTVRGLLIVTAVAALAVALVWLLATEVGSQEPREQPAPQPPAVDARDNQSFPQAEVPPQPLADPSPPVAEGTPAADTGALEGGTESTLVVVTEPAGARVTINGVGWGITPLTIQHLPRGTKRVRVTLEGYLSQEHVVDLNTPRTGRTLRIALEQAPVVRGNQ